ncbi:MAG: crossover junction endodeoxyribonuclease RuvC [Gammaproteobacteria bacterium]
MRIVGIDPGSRSTGFGVIDVDGPQLTYVASGCIRTAKGTHVARLEEIFHSMGEVLQQYAPGEVALEKVFVHRNADSAIKLGQARSAALCAAYGVIESSQVYEYTPRSVKQAVTGYGAAEKSQIQVMIKSLLKLDGALNEDAADALAVAVCHANGRRAGHAIARATGA